MNKNFNIEQFLDLSGYATDERVSRRKNSDINSNEFFTPYSIIKVMCDKISEEDWSDPEKTFCEPCAGNYQFVVYILWKRLMYNIDWRAALKTLYSVELMEDNVKEGKSRLLSLLSQMDLPDYNKKEALEIINENNVCHDFFTWNFEEWREYTQAELDHLKKQKNKPHHNDGIVQEALF